MKVNSVVVIRTETLGGYTVTPEDKNGAGYVRHTAACSTLDEALLSAKKLLEEEK